MDVSSTDFGRMGRGTVLGSLLIRTAARLLRIGRTATRSNNNGKRSFVEFKNLEVKRKLL